MFGEEAVGSVVGDLSSQQKYRDEHSQNKRSRSIFSKLSFSRNRKRRLQDQVAQEKHDLDKYLASTMNALSVADREKALEEVNGVVDVATETPETLAQGLRVLEEHLNSFKRGTTYEMAERNNPSYVKDRSFRIMFLRGNKYNARESAKQMIAFFDTKLMLFGKDKLTKDITLEDLDSDTRAGIQNGSMQVLPLRDRAGRNIWWCFRGGVGRFNSLISELRAHYYLVMSMLESEETQLRGAIATLYVVGQYKDTSGGAGLSKMGKLVRCLPVYWAGFQFCCDDMKQYVAIRSLVLAFPKHLAARFRCHFGTHMHCRDALRQLGIPNDAVPLSPDSNTPLLQNHAMWYRMRVRLDAEKGAGPHTVPSSPALIEDDFSFEDPFDEDLSISEIFDDAPVAPSAPLSQRLPMPMDNPILVPSTDDIVFGPSFKLHPGTLKLHDIIARHEKAYESINSRRQKTEFAGFLVQQIKSSGSRFVAFDKGSRKWLEVDDIEARNKVSKCIRNRRRKGSPQGTTWSLSNALEVGDLTSL